MTAEIRNTQQQVDQKKYGKRFDAIRWGRGRGKRGRRKGLFVVQESTRSNASARG